MRTSKKKKSEKETFLVIITDETADAFNSFLHNIGDTLANNIVRGSAHSISLPDFLPNTSIFEEITTVVIIDLVNSMPNKKFSNSDGTLVKVLK